MTEHENEKQPDPTPENPPKPRVHPVLKAWRWFLWGLKWSSAILFSVLFFVGMYLEIPIKMLICLAFIPIVIIFLPQKVQSWIWVCLTGVILGIFIWVLLPEMNQEDWSAYQYDNELDKILATHSVPDANNAAFAYHAVLEEFDEAIFEFRYPSKQVRRSTLEHIWDPNEYQQLNLWVSIFEPGIHQMVTATQIPECRFDVPTALPAMQAQMKRNNQLKGWTRLLIRTANRDLFLGDEEAAVEKYLAGLSLAQHLYQQKTLFGQAGAFDIEVLSTRGLERYIIDHCQDRQTLTQIENAVSQLDPDWAGCWPEILAREKLITKNIAALFYEVNKEGKIRMSRNVIPDLISGLGFRPQRIFVEQEQMSKVGTVMMWFVLPFSPDKLATAIDERYDYYSLQIQKGEKLPRIPLHKIWILGMNYKSAIDWMAMQQVGYFWALDGNFRRHQSLVNVIHLFTALKRYHLEHNRWPDTLKELELENMEFLIDEVNGKPFAYQPTNESFTLYSLGSNGIDDGGLNIENEKEDDIIFWPRKTEKETKPQPVKDDPAQ